MGYEKYTKLDEEKKNWVLTLSGAELFSASRKLMNEKKIDSEAMKQLNAFWLNEHEIDGPWRIYK